MLEARQWGIFAVIGRGMGYQVKELNVNPGCRLSLQTHQHRAEIWHIIEGDPIVTVGKQTFVAPSGTSVYVPKGEVHRIAAQENLVRIVEIQLGDYLGEDDIVRLEDDYGRV